MDVFCSHTFVCANVSLLKVNFCGKQVLLCVLYFLLYMVHKVIACLVLFQLGNDSFCQDFLCILKNNKINTDHVHITNGVSSGMAQITVAESGERRLVCVCCRFIVDFPHLPHPLPVIEFNLAVMKNVIICKISICCILHCYSL
jgi:hypothetical protein